MDIPVSLILELNTKYSPSQIEMIFNDGSKHFRNYDLKRLFEKADSLDDSFVLNELIKKYDITAVFEDDISGLPQVTKESTEQAFKDIYGMIKTVNPDYDAIEIYKRNKICTKYSGGERRRRYGGKSYRCCFKITDSGVEFHPRTYLFRTKSQNVRDLAELLGCPREMLFELNTDLVEWCLKQKDLRLYLCQILRKKNDPFPIPLEDIVDIEKKIIKFVI